jgi:hypothetical protein
MCYHHLVCRLADHLESCNTFSLKKVKFLVLDEADRLLAGGGGFDKQVCFLESCPLSECYRLDVVMAVNMKKLWGYMSKRSMPSCLLGVINVEPLGTIAFCGICHIANRCCVLHLVMLSVSETT